MKFALLVGTFRDTVTDNIMIKFGGVNERNFGHLDVLETGAGEVAGRSWKIHRGTGTNKWTILQTVQVAVGSTFDVENLIRHWITETTRALTYRYVFEQSSRNNY